MRTAQVLSVVIGLVLLAFLGCSSESAAPVATGGGGGSGGGGGGVIANPTGQFVDAPVQGITVVSNNGAQQSVTIEPVGSCIRPARRPSSWATSCWEWSTTSTTMRL